MQKNKRIRLNFKNIFRALLDFMAGIVVISDLVLVIFCGYQWTWVGLFTFLVSSYLMLDLVWMFMVEAKQCKR